MRRLLLAHTTHRARATLLRALALAARRLPAGPLAPLTVDDLGRITRLRLSVLALAVNVAVTKVLDRLGAS